MITVTFRVLGGTLVSCRAFPTPAYLAGLRARGCTDIVVGSPAEQEALAALAAAPEGIHFQLYPFSNRTLRALEDVGLVVVGRDLYARLTDAGRAAALPRGGP